MVRIHFLLALILVACNAGDPQNETVIQMDTVKALDTLIGEKEAIQKTVNAKSGNEKSMTASSSTKNYSNERFKEVTVKKVAEHKFLVRGKGQIFEASFSWVIEDGHEELRKGFQMTDAGAPEWGNFSFTIDVAKKRANSTLNLILFEYSAKDGSRQYELPVLLY